MESQLKRIKRAQALTWRAQLGANPFKANLCLPVCFVRCVNRRIVIDLRHVYLSTISNEFSRRILQISVKKTSSRISQNAVNAWLGKGWSRGLERLTFYGHVILLCPPRALADYIEKKNTVKQHAKHF